ncbi:unnamed protein product [Blepharisma stoltei]|uniref:Uncharacterized protein n=1 Tax=Blepharisma stoltei TaxID=1481888 RepID=A0AAU9JKS4_9CILI|nr:unnamed protein product [Blepharisma stoltei]
MEIESNFDQERQNAFKLHCFLGALLNVLVIVVQLVDLTLTQWVHYCYFDWGLYAGETSETGLDQRVSNNESYEDMNNNMCDYYKDVIDAACNDFCGNLTRFWTAGGIMIGFLSVCIFINATYVVLHICMYFGKKCKHWIWYHGIWAPTIIFFMGLTIYLAVGDIYGVDKTWDGDENLRTGHGLSLAFSIVVLHFLPAIHSYIFTSQELRK